MRGRGGDRTERLHRASSLNCIRDGAASQLKPGRSRVLLNLAALFSRQTWVVVAPSLTVADFTRATQGGQLVHPTGTVLLGQARLLNRTISRNPLGGVSE